MPPCMLHLQKRVLLSQYMQCRCTSHIRMHALLCMLCSELATPPPCDILMAFCPMLTNRVVIHICIVLEAQDIGTPVERLSSSDYEELEDDSARFYLNTEFPAIADGTVTSLSFCYDLNGPVDTTYQATIGFYHMEGTNYSLIDSFNLSRSRLPARCENISIPPIEVQQGDVIGVCARDFSPSVRRINFVVESDRESDDLQRERGGDNREMFCTAVGDVPRSLSGEGLTGVDSLVMRITGAFGESVADPPHLPYPTKNIQHNECISYLSAPMAIYGIRTISHYLRGT